MKLDIHHELILLRVEQKHSDTQIAEELGTTSKMIYKFRKKYGIPACRKAGAQPGSEHRNWKGGRILDKSGYVLLYRPEHPQAGYTGYVREHRLVMEEAIGRPLTPKEVVHHKDGDKQNNAIENLSLYSHNGDHLKEELTGKCPQWSGEGRQKILQACRKRRGAWKNLSEEEIQAVIRQRNAEKQRRYRERKRSIQQQDQTIS